VWFQVLFQVLFMWVLAISGSIHVSSGYFRFYSGVISGVISGSIYVLSGKSVNNFLSYVATFL
jgi:hypothetical protein